MDIRALVVPFFEFSKSTTECYTGNKATHYKSITIN